MIVNQNNSLWVETRDLQPKLKQPLQGIINLLLVTALFLLVWWIFMDPRGIIRWYTPQYGYMYIRWILIAAIWQVYIFNYWPFKDSFLNNKHPLVKGLILIGSNIVIVAFMVWVFCYAFLGNLSIPYLNPKVLTGLGMTEFFAREYSSLAILMMAAIASWLSPVWPVCFDNHPWQNLTQPARGFTVWAWTFFLTLIAFLILMHPHYHVLFYPWQEYAAAYPWWYDFAHTLSGNFNVGWVMCGTVSIWFLELVFDRYPIRLIKKQPLRGIIGFLFVFTMAWLIFFAFLFLQDVSWGPAVEGAKRLYAPDWRHLHCGELACMMLIPMMTLHFYFDNWPKKYSPSINIAIRCAIIFIATGILHYLYYKYSPPILGTQPGYSHPQQFPMAPVILWINMMLYHYWFMDMYPGKRLATRKERLPVSNLIAEEA